VKKAVKKSGEYFSFTNFLAHFRNKTSQQDILILIILRLEDKKTNEEDKYRKIDKI